MLFFDRIEMILSCHTAYNAIIADIESSEFRAFSSLRAFLVRKTYILVFILSSAVLPAWFYKLYRNSYFPRRLFSALNLLKCKRIKMMDPTVFGKKVAGDLISSILSEDCTRVLNNGHNICRMNDLISRFEIKLKSFDNGSGFSRKNPM